MTQVLPTETEITPDLIWRLVDDNMVIVKPDDGEVLVLSDSGSHIWQQLTDKKEVSDIESFLVNHYIVSQEQARADIVAFLAELAELGLVVHKTL